jgi:hypothetical protein
MELWEIAKNMGNNRYSVGTVFQNSDLGDMIISFEGELVWNDTCEPVSIMLGDDVLWEVLE